MVLRGVKMESSLSIQLKETVFNELTHMKIWTNSNRRLVQWKVLVIVHSSVTFIIEVCCFIRLYY